jgi:serine protease Do
MDRRLFGVRLHAWTVAYGLVALVFIASLATVGWDHASAQQMPAAQASAGDQGAVSYAKSLSKAFREAAQRALPAVVTIRNAPVIREQPEGQEEMQQSPSDENPFGDMLPPEFRHFFKQLPQGPRLRVPHGEMGSVGSGVIIDPSGVILTNNHVVEGGGKITVRLHDGREFETSDIKADPKTDLAIVRIKGAGTLTAAKFGNSDEVQVGDWVLALGNPFGQEGTVTAGIISAKGRPLDRTRASFLQTDAAINPGNSGGPLVNLDGEIVGINRAIASNTGGYQGVGFAIASNLAKWVSRQLTASGLVKRAYLGVGIQSVDQDLAKQFGVESREGAIVSAVQPNAPAAKAGVKPGDLIVEFAGKPVANPQELQQAVDQAPIGQKQALVVVRGGKRTTLEVIAREQPADYGLARSHSMMPGKEGSLRDQKLGIEVSELSSDVAEKLGVKADQGVVITSVRNGSPADLAGLASGMVIAQVGQKPVKSVDGFRAAMEKQSLRNGVMLLIHSSEGARFIVIRSAQ